MPFSSRGLVAACCLVAAAAAQSTADFASGPVHPLDVSADGTRLFAVDTVGGRLSVFDLSDPSAPFLLAEIPVGVDPVSVRALSRDEVWVVDQVSDGVSVVDVPQRRVIATLRVVDEPSDVVFAGGKAFVSAAARDELQVFDAQTFAALGTVPVFGKDPRALAVSSDGSKVYAVVQRSGNGTTILPASVAPPPPLPWNVSLPAAPQQGLIVRADDPAWSASIQYSLPDHDVAEIDVATQVVTRYFDAVGTTNTAIAVDAASGDLWVANTEARNLVRFEPVLRGHAVDSRVTRITTGAASAVTPFDLNPGFDYSTLPNTNALSTALAEPFGVAIDAATGRLYVAAHGTDRVGVLDFAGSVLARIEVGPAAGAAIDTRHKRGPRGLALHPTAPRLYVLNRLSDTLSVIDTASDSVLGEQRLATVDPMPAALREGRNFLYDAKLSGNGTMSCASCHIDGDLDGIAWDLGDPSGSMQNAPAQPFPFNIGLTQFHPMKGPMTTQTLRGLAGVGVLHWRGDRSNFQAFNGAFDSLMGGAQLSVADMNAYAAFAVTMKHPPNPNQLLDRSLRTAPAGNNEAAGLAAYNQNIAGSILPTGTNCNTCHTLPTGTNGLVITNLVLQEPQQMKVPQVRNMYRKVGMLDQPGPQKSGFGYTHDGALDTLASFFAQPVFNPWPAATKDDIVTFLMAIDTGTAPAVGYRLVLAQANAGSPQVQSDLTLLRTRAAAGDLDLTAHGVVDGRLQGLLYQPGSQTFVSDRAGDGPWTAAQLLAKAAAGQAELALLAAPVGTGQRVARDRDLDAVLDGDEDADGYGAPTAGCAGAPRLLANSEPRLGNQAFGFAMDNAPASSIGMIALSLGQASFGALGVTILVDPGTAVPLLLTSDGHGEAIHRFPIPANPGVTGASIFAQTLWLDACGAEWFSSTGGVALTVGP